MLWHVGIVLSSSVVCSYGWPCCGAGTERIDVYELGLRGSLVVCDVEYVERWLTQMCGVLPNACDVAQAAPEVVIMHVQ